MLCNRKVNGKSFTNCLDYVIPVEGQTYCSVCEKLQPERGRDPFVPVINIAHQTEHVKVHLVTCKNCQADFDRWGCD